MDVKDFPFHTIYSSVIKPLVSQEKDKYLALASLVDVGHFIPNIDIEHNIDLLPVAFNACVINRANKNGDVIDTATALDIYQHFINKPINIEHNRQKIIGTILTAGFSEFGTDKPLSPAEVKDLKTPFNITLGGVLWKIVNQEMTDHVEESNDSSSEYYQSISASWELGFSEYNIAISENESKNLEDCKVIDNEAAASADKYLKANGGTGKLQDGKNVYRKVIGKVVPLGIGLTENPAAEVKGVAINTDAPSKNITVSDDSSEKISQSSNSNVNINSNKIMKINSLEDINDKNWKELSASAVTEFIAENIKKASEEYVAEKNKYDEFVNAAQATEKKMQDDYAGLKAAMDGIQAELKKLQEEKSAREKMDVFNARMCEMDSSYALNEEMAKTVAEQLKKCDTDEDFATYKSNMAVFLKPFERKAATAANPSDDKQNKGPTEQTPEVNMKDKKDEKPFETKASAQEIVDKALDNAKQEKVSLPNSVETKKPTLVEKFAQAFSLEDGFVVNKNRR